jgi:type II secretory pathway pseudopilin PulG
MNNSLRPLRAMHPGKPRGVMLLALLLGLALSGIALMGAVDVWTLQTQREREQQLLFAGDQYRLAIQRYFYAAPQGMPKSLPLSFESLLEDDRFPMPVRHLRRLYPDPITGKPWGEVRTEDGRLSGVYSTSEAMPVKQAGFSHIDQSFSEQPSYQKWVFEFGGAPRQTGASATESQRGNRPGIPERPDLGRTK